MTSWRRPGTRLFESQASSLKPLRRLATAAVLLALVGSLLSICGVPAQACPFCSAVSQTFSEEIGAADAAVIAKLSQPAPKSPGAIPGGEVPKTKFEIVQVLKGQNLLGKTRTFETIYFGDAPLGTLFLVMGIDPANLNWSTPVLMSQRGRGYLEKALKLPPEGPERLAFFQEYLEDGDEILARDAYDEFAKAPYGAVKQIKDRMHRDKLIQWVRDPKVTGSRRRLYFTMLGVCGNADDLQTLESMMRSGDREQKLGLDALIAAYLMLKGPDGMPLVESLFLSNPKAEYTDTYAAIMALRFHGQEETAIPRERLLAGLRTMLDRPQLADLVIPDLARWEDWSVVDRLVTLFKNADEESSWVRVPVVKYLQACPLPAAKTHLEELTKIDPEVVRRASTFFPFGGPAAKVPADAKGSAAGSGASGTKASGDGKASSGDAPAKDAAGSKSSANGQSPDAQKSSSAGPSPLKTESAATQPASDSATLATAAAAPPASDASRTSAQDASRSSAQDASRSSAGITADASAATASAEPHTVAAIGATSLAPNARAAGAARVFGSLEVYGGLAVFGGCLVGATSWILLGGQRHREL